MAGSWTADRFPQFESSIRRLTEQHRELVDEPLHLAVSYLPAARDQQHVFLFEVVGGIADRTAAEQDLFETTFLPTPGFPMRSNEQLHLILANPHELEVGVREEWPLVREIIGAVRTGDFRVLYSDDIGQQLLLKLQAEARSREAVRG